MNRWWRRALALVVVLAVLGGLLIGLRQMRVGPGATETGTAVAPARPALALTEQDLLLAQRQPLQRGVAISGTVKATRIAWVKAKVPGELQLLTVREGDSVRAGQVLGQIDATEAELRLRQAGQQADAAKAQLDIAERQLANNQALVAQGFISPTALQTSQANDAAARANWQAAQSAVALANKALQDASVRAPMAGQVSQRLVQAGERVAVEARLLEIIDLSALELEAAVAPQDLAALRLGAIATLNVEGLDMPLQAKVVRINPSAAAGTRSVLAYLSVPPNAHLRHGLFAQGWLSLGGPTEKSVAPLVLPMSALRLDASKPYVIVVQQDLAEHRPVVLGERGRAADGTELVAIAQGLVEGERVLAASAGLVATGTALRLPGAAAVPAASAAAPAASASR